MLLIGRMMTAAGLLWLMANGPAAAAWQQGTPVILQGGGQGANCSLPPVNENTEIRDVSAEVAVTGPLLANAELLLSATNGKPSESQQILLPLVQTSAAGQYNVHAQVLLFAFKDAAIEFAITSSLGGQTINIITCNAAGWQGFPIQ
jgi:hypothetical protein